MHPTIDSVTKRIAARSKESRAKYLARIQQARAKGVTRAKLSCGNLAHGFAACSADEKKALAETTLPNIGIISAYNDMLSAHQPLKDYPAIIKSAVQGHATAQFAGGVPAMCDGVTQGQTGMELSLFSRDVIAMATAVSLSHDMFDAALMLGVCDKIVPGLLIGALSFGHLPTVFVPAGPMTSGLSNPEKSHIRQLYAAGKIDRKSLLEAEAASYHAPGTCTFYGTANSNQMLMEIMGLHIPGSAFVNPDTPLRTALTAAAAKHVASATALGANYRPIGEIVDEKALVNAIVGLVATGGSTNHTIHLIAIAAAAGVKLEWEDFADISKVTPLLCRIYPNGQADVNHFQAAGGFGFLLRELLNEKLLHPDVRTLVGDLHAYTKEPYLKDGDLRWRDPPTQSLDKDVLRSMRDPFASEGGIRVLTGNLGQSIIKVSAVKPEHRVIEAPAMVFTSQQAVQKAFKEGKLHKDVVVVVKGQGPRANGMPELHQLTPALGVLLDLGYNVALVTDGRMSGASGKVPAAIHLSPEAIANGPIARIQDGDIIRLDTETSELMVKMQDIVDRKSDIPDVTLNETGCGRELFAGFRTLVSGAEQGAVSFSWDKVL